MSTIAFRASLVREIEQVMKRLEISSSGSPLYNEGRLDAYVHVLTLVSDMEGE